jgi:hypothetical protein
MDHLIAEVSNLTGALEPLDKALVPNEVLERLRLKLADHIVLKCLILHLIGHE